MTSYVEGASPPAGTRAQAFVEVSGGIAEVTTYGDVDIVLIDWDNVEEGDLEYLEDILDEAQQIFDDEIRARVTNDLAARIADLKADAELDIEQSKKRRLEERERAASILGIEEGSPAWQFYTQEDPED